MHEKAIFFSSMKNKRNTMNRMTKLIEIMSTSHSQLMSGISLIVSVGSSK